MFRPKNVLYIEGAIKMNRVFFDEVSVHYSKWQNVSLQVLAISYTIVLCFRV